MAPIMTRAWLGSFRSTSAVKWTGVRQDFGLVFYKSGGCRTPVLSEPGLRRSVDRRSPE